MRLTTRVYIGVGGGGLGTAGEIGYFDSEQDNQLNKRTSFPALLGIKADQHGEDNLFATWQTRLSDHDHNFYEEINSSVELFFVATKNECHDVRLTCKSL